MPGSSKCGQYCEVQIWAPLDLTDVEYLMVKPDPPISEELKALGIPIYQVEYQGRVDSSRPKLNPEQTAQFKRGTLFFAGGPVSEAKQSSSRQSIEAEIAKSEGVPQKILQDRLLAKLEDKGLIDRFRAQAKSPSWGIENVSARARLFSELATRPLSEEITKVLKASLGDLNGLIRQKALLGLSDLPVSEFRPLLLKALADSSVTVRNLAVAMASDFLDDTEMVEAAEKSAALPTAPDKLLKEDEGLHRLCERNKFKTGSDSPAPQARYQEEIPDVGVFLAKWKFEEESRGANTKAQIQSHRAKRMADYAIRRLLAHYRYSQTEKGGQPTLAEFCAANEERLLDERSDAKSYLAVEPLRTAEQCRLVEETGISELEATGISSYTGLNFMQINRALWEAKQLKGAVPLSGKVAAAESAFRKGMDRLPTYRAAPVKRYGRLPDTVLVQHQEGAIVTYDAYTSTSRRQDWTWGDGATHRFLIYGGRDGKEVTAFSKKSDRGRSAIRGGYPLRPGASKACYSSV